MDSSEEDDIILAYIIIRRQALRRRKERARKRWWVHPIFQERHLQGAYANLVANMREYPDKFHNFHRLTCGEFDILLDKVRPIIIKKYYRREPVCPGLRLSLTLRYVASGDSMVSLSYLYRVAPPTISQIIQETANAIWTVLQPEFLAMPSEEDWMRISKEFETQWNFPNCVGSIDGKHVVCQSFQNTGSNFFNYKHSFSTILLAVSDAVYRFSYVSIGSAGRESDGGIFQDSDFARGLENNEYPLPPPRKSCGSTVFFPPVFLGDAAFPLKQNLMKPYPGQNIGPREVIFNYRHSRARRTVENAFGVLAARMRIFRKPIIASYETVNSIVKCCVVLHNWLRTIELNKAPGERNYIPPGFVDDNDEENGRWREEQQPEGLLPLPPNVARNPTVDAKNIRAALTDHFMKEGSVHWQWKKLPAHIRQTAIEQAEL